MTLEADPWEWWAKKLLNIPTTMNPDTPHAGFYRWPRKFEYGARKTFLPVAYWPENGALRCREGDKNVDAQRGMAIWHFVGEHPVTEEAYRTVAQHGGLWPDEHHLVPMGDNLPPETDTLETLQDRIYDLSRDAKTRLEGEPIKDQDEADRISNLADALQELHKKADAMRKEERKPHDEVLKEIQTKWAPILLAAEVYRNLKFKLLTPWAKRFEEDLQRRADEAAFTGEVAPPPEKRRAKMGTRGRAMSLRGTKRAHIENYREVLKFFSDSEDMRKFVQELADKAVRAGITVPGTKVIEEKQVV